MPQTTSNSIPILENPAATLTGQGLTSRQPVRVNLYRADKGSGIYFILSPGGFENADTEERLMVKAHADSVISTTRNTALGEGKVRVCFVEHILCALALAGIEDMYIEVLGPELPMGNGSCDLWIELLKESNLLNPIPEPSIELNQPIILKDGQRSLMALPSDRFSVTYLLDMKHPKIGKMWGSWSHGEDMNLVAEARTFGPLIEHQMLGFDKDVVSYTNDDFTMPLKSPDEPVRHKLLDVIGDLMLCGVNPLAIKADFISIRGGHAIDVEMAKRLKEELENSH